jgi:tRNA pseudouridine32 synthase / 23S rRNA pseudouridine746 synthase
MLEIIHRDHRLAVINKPANVSLLADRSGAACLWDSLPGALGAQPLLVHRLDKGTSGVLLIALEREAQKTLTRAFQQRRVRKYYVAWVQGGLETGRSLTVDLPLRKGRKSRYRVAGPRERIRCSDDGWRLAGPHADGFDSVTRLRRLRQVRGRTLLLAAPITGRTHQLRVHLAWIGHPIMGDSLYGRPAAKEQQAPRLQLHCHRLVIPGFGSFVARSAAGWLSGSPSGEGSYKDQSLTNLPSTVRPTE